MMNIEEKNRINMERKREFKKNCKKVNARAFNCRWDWKEINNNIGQIVIYNYNGDPVTLWEETREQLQMLIDEWDFRESQYLAVGITCFHRIVGVGSGIYNIAWMDKDTMFQSIYFEQEDVQLSIPSEQSTIEELKELDELCELDLDPVE